MRGLEIIGRVRAAMLNDDPVAAHKGLGELAHEWESTAARLAAAEQKATEQFVAEVERRAEANMLKTHICIGARVAAQAEGHDMSKWTYPNIIDVFSVMDSAECTATSLPSGKYVPARPLGFQSIVWRLRATWLVFTGRADALTWPGQP